jgi:tetratricopeptide (TPR) repeat protein
VPSFTAALLPPLKLPNRSIEQAFLLTALDRHEDAVAAYTEAATIWQKLCGVRPHLAWSFHNMGLSLAELGRHEAAVEAHKFFPS